MYRLVIDIGNTNVVVGLFKDQTLKDHLRLATRTSTTDDEAGLFISDFLRRMGLSNEDVEDVVLASVVPALTPVYESTSKRHFGCQPIIVSHKLKLPVKIAIDHPDQVGADRIANAVAGYSRFGGPVIVIDFGTAINFDIVDKDANYIGGVLLPGPKTAMEDLARRAARLFEVRIEPPDSVVGKSTAGALKSGLFYGTVGQIDFLVDKIIEETKFRNPTVVATGGLAHGIQNHSRHISLIEPTLTLEGLRIIGEMNASPQ